VASDEARRRSTNEREVAEAVQEVGERLAGEIEDLGGRLAQHLFREIPALGGDPELTAEVQDTVIASLRGWLGMVRRGSPVAEVTPAAEVLNIVQTWVLRGAPLPTLLRAFHLGHGFLISEVVAGIPEAERRPELLGAAIERLLTLSFAYIDALTVHVVDVYTSERARLLRGADAARAEAARRILTGAEIDVDAASRELGYELRRWHVGMLLWGDPADASEHPLSRLEEAAGEIATALGSARPLLVPAGRSLLWAWCGTSTPPPAETFAELRGRRLGDCISAALGEPGDGAEGFGRTHADALEARRVALDTRQPGAVTLYADVELLSLLAADPERARRFMLEELGALGADDDGTARLRTTLRVYLEEGRSYVRAARRLGGHANTIKYRVRRCEELLGRPVGESSLTLASALLLADTLGPGDTQDPRLSE